MNYELQLFADSDTGIIRQTLSGGIVVSGRSGPFTPADAYRLDLAWDKLSTLSGGDFDVSFVGDVESAIYSDGSGMKVVELTILDYDSLKLEIKTMEETLSNLIEQLAEISVHLEEMRTQISARDLSALETDLSALTEQVNELKSNKELDELESELGTLAEQVTILRDVTAEAVESVTSIGDNVEELRMQTEEVSSNISNLEEEQKNYLRYANYSTSDGSVVLADGYGIEAFTFGTTTYTTVSATLESETVEGNPDD